MHDRGEGLGLPVVCLLLAFVLVSVGFWQVEGRRERISDRAADACLSAATSEHQDCYVTEFRKSSLTVIWPYLLGGALSAAFGAVYLYLGARQRGGGGKPATLKKE
jgi:hypothetical protein